MIVFDSHTENKLKICSAPSGQEMDHQFSLYPRPTTKGTWLMGQQEVGVYIFYIVQKKK